MLSLDNGGLQGGWFRSWSWVSLKTDFLLIFTVGGGRWEQLAKKKTPKCNELTWLFHNLTHNLLIKSISYKTIFSDKLNSTNFLNISWIVEKNIFWHITGLGVIFHQEVGFFPNPKYTYIHKWMFWIHFQRLNYIWGDFNYVKLY